jgi:hypothetical protein
VVEDLQEIVDRLAEELQRGVALDDEHFRLVAHSPHHGAVDALRRESILTRRVPTASQAWIHEQGVAEASDPVRLPANRQLGAAGRVCAPARYASTLLGFLFVSDPGQTLTDAELARCREAADASAVLLYRRRFAREAGRARDRQAVLDVIRAGGSPAAAAALAEAQMPATGPFAALVVGARPGGTGGRDRDVELGQVLQALRRGLPGRCLAGLVRPGEGCAIVDARALARGGDPLWLARRAQALAAERLGAPAVVGQGEPANAVEEVGRSYAQAGRALRLAERVSGFAGVVDWSRAGAYRMLDGGEPELPPALVRLLEREDLLRTLETYLDLAGDARAAAAALSLHRASLYHRLQRIEAIAGVDLGRGEDRLAMHVGIALLRLGAGRDSR